MYSASRRGTELEEASHFYSLADMSPDGVIIHVNGEVVFANQSTANLLQLDSSEDLLGHSLYEYISQADQAMLDARLQGILIEKLRLPFYEYTLMRKRGKTIQVEMCGQPIEWKGQKAVQTIIRDLTERHEKEDAFRTLKRALEQCPDSVIITNQLGVVEYVNSYFVERYGYSLGEMGDMRLIYWLRRLMPRTSYRNLLQTLSEGRVWKSEFFSYSKSGRRYWEQATVAPILDNNQKVCHYICIMKDITTRKKTEENMQSALEMAKEASAAKSAFLANMSHEFRTPLNAIIGFNSILASGPSEATQGKVVEYSQYALDAGEHMLKLVTDLLDLAKIESNQLALDEQTFQVVTLVDNIKRLVAKTAEKNQCKLVTNISDQFVLIADNRRVKQILLNLVFNAIKFSEGGVVSIEARNPEDGTIYIRDTGIGMTPKEIELALSPFGQAEGNSFSKKYDGAGLGLPIARNLMELHGGNLLIESVPGEGSQITLTFPKSRISSVNAEAKYTPSQSKRTVAC